MIPSSVMTSMIPRVVPVSTPMLHRRGASIGTVTEVTFRSTIFIFHVPLMLHLVNGYRGRLTCLKQRSASFPSPNRDQALLTGFTLTQLRHQAAVHHNLSA